MYKGICVRTVREFSLTVFSFLGDYGMVDFVIIYPTEIKREAVYAASLFILQETYINKIVDITFVR